MSLRHLQRHLTRHPIYAVTPASLELDADWLEVQRFDDAFFRSVDTYSKLLLTPAFYERFTDYDYILIYQLDALVFRDELESWCARGYDYVGAPWLRDSTRPHRGFSRVGNGGLSLRRVQSFTRVLTGSRAPMSSLEWLGRAVSGREDEFYGLSVGGRTLKAAKVLRDVHRGAPWYAARYSLNEDHFWSDRARLFDRGFRIPSPETAVNFAFDVAPRYCFERTGGTVPFGCHGWARHDREFWEPFLLPDDAAVPSEEHST